jgi:hypothetical protein
MRTSGCGEDWRSRAERPKTVWFESDPAVPVIIAGEVNMAPAQWGKVAEEGVGNHDTVAAKCVERAVEVDGVP